MLHFPGAFDTILVMESTSTRTTKRGYDVQTNAQKQTTASS